MSSEEPEYLENGRNPRTPEDDTYIRRFNLNSARVTELIAGSVGGHAVRDAAFRAADTGRPAGFTNSVILMQPLPANPDPILQEIDNFYSLRDGGAQREVLLFSAWPTPDLRERGWSLAGHPPVHLMPANRPRPPLPPGLRISRVGTRAELDAFEQVAIDGYPFEGLTAGTLFGDELLADPAVGFWVGYDRDKPVAVASSLLDCGINNVMLVATLPEARGRGFGEALTWAASQIDPTVPAMLLSSDLGRPVYERMGYLPLFRFTLWYRMR